MTYHPSKVLIIGSGPIIIGQAAEFDYAGTQACKAMREEGVISVLVNSNPATIMTDEEVADVVYIEPLTVDMLARIIERERPDGLLPTLGGQTGLTLAHELAEAGVLDKYNVRSLGTSVETIRNASNRELFKNLMAAIGEPMLDGISVNTVPDAKKAAGKLGLPLIIRPSFTLGGTGGGVAYTMPELEEKAAAGLATSPIHQVLLEQWVGGWKEIEYEVMRDAADNCITVCNMENFDPMGVHTGDSIVVAPSQTLTNKEYQMLRTASLNIIRGLKIEGGCNVQFALDPRSQQYYVIEVNPRVSRSSALASKATGYPIARVAAKIATGKTLDQIRNAVTGKTMASFEPALDYVVVKIPRWPFDKFATGDRVIGTQMKATGEVMAIDRTFEAALQKAVRSLEFGKKSLNWEDPAWQKGGDITTYPLVPATDLRLWAIMAALRRGITPQAIADYTKIDLWFLEKLQNIVDMEKTLLNEPMTADLLRRAKRLGFGDGQIGTLADRLPEQVRQMRHEWNIRPVYKMVDTCAAEFDAATPYFYSTYEQENEAKPENVNKAVVIGSGPIRIGQGIEFDYCSVHSAWALQDAGYKSIMINSNPETVSTDFDTSDRLYFEALDEESVRDILENEAGDNTSPPSIVQFGGQTAINLSQPLSRAGLPIIGSSADAIDLASDRKRFELFLDEHGDSPAARRRRHLARRRPQGRRDDRLPRPGASQLRPRRARHGDRLQRHRAGQVHAPGPRAGHRPSRPHRQVPAGQGVRGGRHLRRRGGAHPGHHGAHRARRRPQRRLHGGLPRPQPDQERGRHPGRLRGAHRPGAEDKGPDEHPVRHHARTSTAVSPPSTSSRSTRAPAAPCRSFPRSPASRWSRWPPRSCWARASRSRATAAGCGRYASSWPSRRRYSPCPS